MKPPEHLSMEPMEPTKADLGTNHVRFQIVADLRPFVEAVRRAQEQMARDLGAWVRRVRPVLIAMGVIKAHDEHHPPPLCIDGHAYHRRRKARARRNRR